MKIASLIARVLLGLLFFVSGLNGFFHLFPMPPFTGLAAQFVGALAASHYMAAVFFVELLTGLLLLLNRFVPLALALLAPVLVNILLFHLSMAPSGLPMAALSILLWIVVALGVRPAFYGLLRQKMATSKA